MYMNMYIVMNMNIYIQPEIEVLLRAYDGSMSGLINRLLADFFTSGEEINLKTKSGAKVTIPAKKNVDLPDGKKTIVFDSTPVEPNVFHKLTTDKVSASVRPDIKNLDDGFVEAGKRVAGFECCTKAKPCKHWQWNSETLKWHNSLTGEEREVDQ